MLFFQLLLLCIVGQCEQVRSGLPVSESSSREHEEQNQLREFLAEEIRLSMLPELKKFLQTGQQNWGHMGEKRIVIPAIAIGNRIITPRREEVIKYKDGEWVRYQAAADKPEQTLKVEVSKFEQKNKAVVEFSIRMECGLKVTGDVAIYRVDIGYEAPFEVATKLILECDCRAELKREQNVVDVTITADPKKLDDSGLVLKQLGPLKGNEAAALGKLLQGLFKADLAKQREQLYDKGKAAIAKASLSAKVKPILIDMLID